MIGNTAIEAVIGGHFCCYNSKGRIISIASITTWIGVFKRIIRKGDWRASDPLLPIIPALTNRGFTGHEHIDVSLPLVKLFGLLNEVHWMVLSLFLVMLPLAS
jgi:hypothetical protein